MNYAGANFYSRKYIVATLYATMHKMHVGNCKYCFIGIGMSQNFGSSTIMTFMRI